MPGCTMYIIRTHGQIPGEVSVNCPKEPVEAETCCIVEIRSTLLEKPSTTAYTRAPINNDTKGTSTMWIHTELIHLQQTGSFPVCTPEVELMNSSEQSERHVKMLNSVSSFS